MQIRPQTVSREQGFTLIELIITITIMGIVFSIVYPSLLTDLTHFVRGEEDSSFLQSTHLATYLIENSVRNARDIILLDDLTILNDLPESENPYYIISFNDEFLTKQELSAQNNLEVLKTRIPGMGSITFSKEKRKNNNENDKKLDYLIINMESIKGESYENRFFSNNLELYNKEITVQNDSYPDEYQYQVMAYQK